MVIYNVYKLVSFVLCVKIFSNINYLCFICRFYLYQSSPPFFALYIQPVYVSFWIMFLLLLLLLLLFEILSYDSGDCTEYRLLDCDVVQSGKYSPSFRRKLLPCLQSERVTSCCRNEEGSTFLHFSMNVIYVSVKRDGDSTRRQCFNVYLWL
jgi:hypothetical protein